MNQNLLSTPVFLTVDTFEDQNDGSEIDGLSLRDAIIKANDDANKKYVINLPSGTYTLTLTAEGSLDIGSNIEIIGESAGDTIISASFLGDRIFTVSAIGILTLANVTLQDANVPTDEGQPVRDGGAININPGGKAFIENTIIANNRTNGKGGGIANNDGTLELNDSVVLLNFSVDSGGGIYNNSEEPNRQTGTTTINRSTIAFNSTSNTINEGTSLGGGGIFNDIDGSLTVINSTISNNISFFGGGISTQGSETQIINSTIVQNQGGFGAGIFTGALEETDVDEDTVINTILRNSIVAENINGLDIEGSFDQLSSYNLIGTSANGSLINGSNNNLVGTLNSPVNPLIEDLPEEFETTDGASTILVHPLEQGSPAINVGDNGATQIRDLSNFYGETDQQLKPRIIQDTVDLGSVEYDGSNIINSGGISDDSPNNIYRFQNSERVGTYLFANSGERQSILDNYPQFIEEGLAFKVGIAPDDDLIAIYRFQNQAVPGTYLYTNAIERESVLANYTNFVEEGIAFYVYDGNANQGEDIYRLQNLDQPGTYLFVAEAEKDSILAQYDNFLLEGVAFEVNF